MIHAMTNFLNAASLIVQERTIDLTGLGSITETPAPGWEGFSTGWGGLTDLEVMIPMAVSVLTAVALAFPIAYHPRIYRRATTLDEIEAPKGIIGYAAVSAGIAQIVILIPTMAFVIFGIGGLYRFRTRAGPPKLIYPTIGTVVIGLASGMMLFSLAIVLAILIFALPFWFESRYGVALRVRNLSGAGAVQAIEDYRRVLQQHGAQVVSQISPHTGEFSIVANVPAGVNAADVEADLRKLPTDERGDIRWETQ